MATTTQQTTMTGLRGCHAARMTAQYKKSLEHFSGLVGLESFLLILCTTGTWIQFLMSVWGIDFVPNLKTGPQNIQVYDYFIDFFLYFK